MIRHPIKIHPKVKQMLAYMLTDGPFEGTGIGYSAVVHAATVLANEQSKAGQAFRDMIQQSQISVTIYDGQDEQAATERRLIEEGGRP